MYVYFWLNILHLEIFLIKYVWQKQQAFDNPQEKNLRIFQEVLNIKWIKLQ